VPAAHLPARAAILLMLAALQVAAATCSVCGRQIRGRYLKSEKGDLFCSRECFRQTLPECAVCGRRVEGAHLVHDGKHYCSEACFDTILPKCEICGVSCRKTIIIDGHTYCETHGEGDRCLHCGLPFRNGVMLDDGRKVCSSCRPDLVFSDDKARELYDVARQAVESITNVPILDAPAMTLAGTDELPAHPGLSDKVSVQENGRYNRRTQTVRKEYLFGLVSRSRTIASTQILLLYGLSPQDFTATAAHELTHHVVAERFPRASAHAPSWLKEGLCQYVAAQVCLREGYNDVLERIATSPDTVYGEGYRFLRRKFGHGNWRSIAAWLQTVDFDSLPRRLVGLRPPPPPES
jgi:hypothetical protein